MGKKSNEQSVHYKIFPLGFFFNLIHSVCALFNKAGFISLMSLMKQIWHPLMGK